MFSRKVAFKALCSQLYLRPFVKAWPGLPNVRQGCTRLKRDLLICYEERGCLMEGPEMGPHFVAMEKDKCTAVAALI